MADGDKTCSNQDKTEPIVPKELSDAFKGLDDEHGPRLTSFPTSMSCSQAFDELYQCYSIGGQMRNMWRHGEMNACRQQREKFKFCWAVKLQSKPEQEKRIAQYYKRRLAERKAAKGSSENVWSRRKEPIIRPFLED
uniref:ARAD1B21208p n=1 Tax=Blastobotrys adeninivorans TaxID=409370 RepID=A0A060TD38_BLAAD